MKACKFPRTVSHKTSTEMTLMIEESTNNRKKKEYYACRGGRRRDWLTCCGTMAW